MARVRLVSLLLLICLVSIGLNFLHVSNVEAIGESWLAGWSYRKSHVLANATETVSPELTLHPNDAGTYQLWTRVGGATHWGVTSDEDDATYLSTLNTADRETENLGDTAQTGTINSVTAYIRAKAFGLSTSEQAVIVWRSHSTNYESDAISISRVAFTNYSQARTVNPNTTLAWTWDEINALEVGARASTLAGGEEIRVSEIWVVVNYQTSISSPAGPNYQVQIIVVNGSAADSGNTVNENNKARSDFGDVRFTDDDGSTPLDYWMESLNTGLNATFWVEVADDLTTQNQTIYIYYGKSGATTSSNGVNTFPFFDDFEDASFNTTKWTNVSGTPTEAGGYLRVGNGATTVDVLSNSTVSAGHRQRERVRTSAVTDTAEYCWSYDGDAEYQGFLNSAIVYTYDSVLTQTAIVSPAINTWYLYMYEWNMYTVGQSTKFYMNDSLLATHTTNIPDLAPYIRVLSSSANYPVIDVDWVFISKYVGSEPSHGAWGGEEVATPTIGSATGTNWDDLDNCYAQKKTYTVSVTYSDPSGFAEIHYCELYLKTDGNTTRATFQFHEDDSSWSTPAGSTEWTLTGYSNSSSGNNIAVVWGFQAQWDATEESDLDFLFFVVDAAGSSVNSVSDQNFDVVTRLVTTGFTNDDPRINIAGTTTISGTVYYGNDPASNTASTSYPPDGEFTSVSIHNSAHATQATDNTIVNGAFSGSFAIPNAVQSNTYHAYINLADADGTDQDAVDGDTTAVIGDRIEIYEKDDPIVSGSLSLFDENGLVSPSWFGLWNAMPVFLLCLGFGLTKIPKRKTKARSLAEVLFVLGIVCLVCFSLQSVPAVKATGITRVQGNAKATIITGTLLNVTMASSPIAGNALVLTYMGCASGSNTPSISSISQTGVTWTYQIGKTHASYVSWRGEIWFGVVTSGANVMVNITLDKSAVNHATADVCEYSGLLTSGFLDLTATNSSLATTTPDTGTTSTTTQAEELWVGLTGSTWTTQSSPTNGFTLLDGVTDGSVSNAYLEKIVSSTGTANSGTTQTSNAWLGCIATFKAGAPPDTTKPTYSNIAHNTTVASNLCLFSCYWTDDVGLSGFIFSTNNTGSWTNDTWSDPWTGTPTTGWSNVTKTLNATVGLIIGYNFYCNDTSNNWNTTGIQSLTTTYSAKAQYSNVASNTTLGNQPCLFSSYWTDDQALSGYIFGTNNTGSWNNESWSSMAGATAAWANVTKTLNITYGYRVEFEWWCNDSQNQWNDTGIQFLTITNPTAPTYSSTGYSTANASAPCNFTCYWTDNVELSGFIFSTNNTGSWTNETWSALSGAASWANVTKTLNGTIHLTIGYRWFCNDTGNNWGDTGILTLYLLSSKNASVIVGTYVVIWFKARYDYDDVAYTSGSGSTLSVNGTLATYDSGAGYWWINVTQAVAGNYTYLVSAVSDGVYGLTVYVDSIGSVTVEWTRTEVVPVNNDCAALDLDVGNVLAWRKYYWFNVTSTDEDGFIDMSYTDLGFEFPADTYTNIIVRYTEASSSFSITAGPDYIAISGCTNSSSNNVTQLAFYVAFDWDYPLTYDIDARIITMDDYGSNDTDIYDLNMGYINTVTTTPASSTPRANAGGSVDITGTVIYTGTAIALPDSQVNTDGLIVHNSTHVSQGTGSSGVYSIPITLPTSVGDNAYHIYVNGSDVDFTDEDKGGSVSVASDRIQVNGITLFFEDPDGRVNAGTAGTFSCTAQSEYDGHVLGAGDSLVLTGYIFTYNGTYWVNSSTLAVPTSVTINSLTSVSEVTFGITAGNINANSATGAWDRIRIDTLGVDDGRINVNTQGTFYVSASLETDAHSLGAGDSLMLSGCVFVWNGTYFVNSTTQVAVTSVTIDAFTSGSEANYGITVGNINGKTNTAIWDRIIIDTLACADSRIDVSTQGLFYCTASLEAGGHTLTNGDSLTLSGHVFNWNITSSRFEYYETNASVISTTVDGFTSGNEATYGITVGNINLMTATEVWDRYKVNAASLVFEDPDGRVNVGTVGLYSCTAQSEYDGHVLGAGDSLSINGYGFVYNGTYWVCDVIEPVPVAVTLNGLFLVSEATYGITAGNLNGNSAVGIWDDLRVVNIQPVQYLGSGEYKYEGQLEYGYDLALINGGYVGLEYPNGTLVGKTSSNATGWVTFIVGQSNATSGVFNLYGENETTYSITRSGANQTFTIYLWTLTPQDVSGNSLTNTSHNMTLGTTIVWNGTATTVYVPPDTFNLTVTWLQDLVVNSTVNTIIAGDTTTGLNCTCYPYVIGATRYWVASNATITSVGYVGSLLTVQFSCALNSYVLVASYTTRPSYVLNVTYDYTTAFAPGYLVMPHFGNTTIVAGYESWAGVYVKKTDRIILSAGWVGQRLDIVTNGTLGDTGELNVYCAARGDPTTTIGFTVTSYGGGVFVGVYAFASQHTGSLEWTPSIPTGGGPSGEPQALSLFITLAFSFPKTVQSGATVDGFLNVSWMGAPKIYIWSAVVEANYASDWEIQIARLPWTLETLMQSGLARVPVVLYITGSLATGNYSVPCVVTFHTVEGVGKTVRSIVTFEVTIPIAQVPSTLVYVFLIGISLVVTSGLFLGTQKRRKYSQ